MIIVEIYLLKLDTLASFRVMGVTKQHLRYVASGLFGLIGSSRANIVFLNLAESPGKHCAVAACEHVFIWDLRKVYKVMLQNLNHWPYNTGVSI